MPDDNASNQNNSNTNNNGAGDQNNSGNGGGTDPNKKTDTQNTQAIDVSKLGDEDFTKVFDDPRLWNHPRFKDLNDKAKKAKEYEEAQRKQEEENLKKKGEFETLAKTKEEEANKWKQKFTTAQVDNRIQSEAAKLGVVDLEAVLKLIDRTNIKLNDDGTVDGVAEAVKGLLDSKPYLKGSGSNPIVGTGTNPGANNQSGLKRFKLSELQDPTFYRENEKDILAAYKAGLIEDDVTPNH